MDFIEWGIRARSQKANLSLTCCGLKVYPKTRTEGPVVYSEWTCETCGEVWWQLVGRINPAKAETSMSR